MVKAAEIRQKYLDFFKDRGHVEIPSAPLVPENDPTTLFTGSGMQPLVQYLLGKSHPLGKCLVNSQKCFRSQDIDEVGDNRHTTFFEMLGNWSLGGYFKEKQLQQFYEFLTKELGLLKEKLAVSVFEGKDKIPRDEESAAIWKKLGIPENRIFYYGISKNWWSRSGVPENMPTGEPGGPDSEVFFEFTKVKHNPKFGKECHPNCDCGRFMEIGNSVFMQYQKQADGSFKELPQKNVDFGGGLERLTAATNNTPEIFEIDLFKGLQDKILSATSLAINEVRTSRVRIFLDHSRAAIFLISENVHPGKNEREYMVRKLIRRADDQLKLLGLDSEKCWKEATSHYCRVYKDVYSYFWNIDEILGEVINELRNYGTVFKKIEEVKETLLKIRNSTTSISTASGVAGPIVFTHQSSLGIPYNVSEQLINELGFDPLIVKRTYDEAMKKHKEMSRTASAGMFKGGLADQSEIVTKYHTATHLLHAALRQVLGTHVSQSGSNITAARLRFDFSHPEKLTDDQIIVVENLVNQKISDDIAVVRQEMPKAKALAEGALAFFPEKYPEVTSVYSIGDFSKELCGGPHVQSTREIGRIKITRQEAVSAGVRRIYATAIS